MKAAQTAAGRFFQAVKLGSLWGFRKQRPGERCRELLGSSLRLTEAVADASCQAVENKPAIQCRIEAPLEIACLMTAGTVPSLLFTHDLQPWPRLCLMVRHVSPGGGCKTQ